MDKINDGGPAFPIPGEYTPEGIGLMQGCNGMSLRDWYAGQAPVPSQDEIDTQHKLDRIKNPHNEPHRPRLRERHEVVADLMFRHADAMLKARQALKENG